MYGIIDFLTHCEMTLAIVLIYKRTLEHIKDNLQLLRQKRIAHCGVSGFLP